jgi:hypothetical protein
MVTGGCCSAANYYWIAANETNYCKVGIKMEELLKISGGE